MSLRDLALRCPRCGGHLAEHLDELQCDQCPGVYPIILGIPDLRIFPDPYIDIEADHAKALRLAEYAQGRTFAELVEYYYSVTPAVPPQHAQLYARGLLTGEARALETLQQWEHALGTAKWGSMLEVGCGTGPLLLAASSNCESLVGVDIAFRWLVIGKKRLEEAGHDVPLICACAEALPFEKGSFDSLVMDSTIEHFRDQPRALAEGRRVVREGGVVCVATPNRFSLGPDPHLGILGGSILPTPVLKWYAKRTGAVPPQRRLVSAFSLRRGLHQAAFRDIVVFLPRIGTEQRNRVSGVLRRIVDFYNATAHGQPFRSLWSLVGPLLFAVGRASPGRGGETHTD